jgi:parallel beta-helix repeat protein
MHEVINSIPRLVWLVVLMAACSAVPFSLQAKADDSPPPLEQSKTFIVALDGTGEYRSIQEAIDQAPRGATIRIKAGHYQEDVTVHSKDAIRLVGEGAGLVTVVGRNRVGAFHIGKWPYGATNVEISGLTVKERGGLALGIFNGRGIVLREVAVEGLLFSQQVLDLRIEQCDIGGSETSGAQFADTQAVLLGNRIHDNDHGVTVAGRSDVRLESNVISRNLFEGVMVTDQAHALLQRNTIVNNGGGVAFLAQSRGEASGNIIGLNRIGVLIASSSIVKLAHNALYNGENNYVRAGSENVTAPELKPALDVIVDPRFVDPGQGDYRLRSETPLTEIGGFPFLGALAPVDQSR